MMNMKALFWTIWPIVVFTSAAAACTCTESYRPPSYIMEGADAVFIGKVSSVTEIPPKKGQLSDFDLLTTFSVEKRYKGLSDTTQVVSIKTNYKANSCGYWVDGKPKPEKGQTWFAFTRRAGEALVLDGTCDGSGVIKDEESRIYFDEELNLKIVWPAIALRVISRHVPVEPLEAYIKGIGIGKQVKARKDGLLLFDGLAPGDYLIEIALPYENLEFASYLFQRQKTIDVERVGEKQWVASFNVHLEPGRRYLFRALMAKD